MSLYHADAKMDVDMNNAIRRPRGHRISPQNWMSARSRRQHPCAGLGLPVTSTGGIRASLPNVHASAKHGQEARKIDARNTLLAGMEPREFGHTPFPLRAGGIPE